MTEECCEVMGQSGEKSTVRVDAVVVMSPSSLTARMSSGVWVGPLTLESFEGLQKMVENRGPLNVFAFRWPINAAGLSLDDFQGRDEREAQAIKEIL